MKPASSNFANNNQACVEACTFAPLLERHLSYGIRMLARTMTPSAAAQAARRSLPALLAGCPRVSLAILPSLYRAFFFLPFPIAIPAGDRVCLQACPQSCHLVQTHLDYNCRAFLPVRRCARPGLSSAGRNAGRSSSTAAAASAVPACAARLSAGLSSPQHHPAAHADSLFPLPSPA